MAECANCAKHQRRDDQVVLELEDSPQELQEWATREQFDRAYQERARGGQQDAAFRALRLIHGARLAQRPAEWAPLVVLQSST